MNSCRSQPCQNGGQCHNQGTSYYCQCAPGYRGNRCENGECYFLVVIDTLQLNHRWLKRGKQAFYNKLLHLWLSEIKSNPLTWFLITNSSLRLERIHTISKMREFSLHLLILCYTAKNARVHCCSTSAAGLLPGADIKPMLGSVHIAYSRLMLFC